MQTLTFLRRYQTPFRITSSLLRQALLEQFEARETDTKFVDRPTRPIAAYPFFETYFDFDFEIVIFCMSRKIFFKVDRQSDQYFFYSNS